MNSAPLCWNPKKPEGVLSGGRGQAVKFLYPPHNKTAKGGFHTLLVFLIQIGYQNIRSAMTPETIILATLSSTIPTGTMIALKTLVSISSNTDPPGMFLLRLYPLE